MSAAGVISLNWRRDGHASSDDLCVVSDERLVAAAKIGHQGAFDDLYQRHAEKMLRITYRITRNRQDAEDAVQESLANAFSRLASFAGASRFSTWLTRIAINAALMKLRKKRLSREVPMEEPPERGDAPPLYAPIDPAPNPEEWYSVRERNRILREAVAKLRPKLREIVEVHGLNDNSIQKTAEILGISTGAAKARMFHARTALRREPELRVIVERTKAATGSSRLGARR
jgi:RNA polymerase sigma-70 factor, ECF subfamily